tara:strand:- start:141 stop:545 length:405 start_codon:yes stop_codon:yes gene_type:complete
MFIYHKCIPINDFSYDEKLPLSMKDKYINQYNLIEKGIVKDYWIMNVYIQDINNHKEFRYYNDKSITYNNGYLLQEVDIKECIPFNFYKVDLEDTYILYSQTINDCEIFLKEYGKYITFEIQGNNKESIDFLIK